MGIQDLHNLFNDLPEEQVYVVLVGRTGKHIGTNFYTVRARSKRDALSSSTSQYRRSNQLGKNIALVNKIVYTGTEHGAQAFMNRLNELVKEEDNGA